MKDFNKITSLHIPMFRDIKNFFSLRIFVLLLLLLGAAACKSTEPTQQASDTKQQEASASETSELEELYWARIDSSRSSFTKADVKFMTGMICHHAQALVMSRLAPENGASSAVQRLAARIINAQKDEILTMQQWLRDRDQPVPKIEIEGLNLMIKLGGKPFTKYKKMAGVLSDKQLEELADAQNSEFDRLFLKYMIEHHSGAVVMVKNLFATDGAAQDNEAFRLASDIQVDQITEIERMNLMLENLPQSG